MLSILVYDAEIRNPIATAKDVKRPGYTYADGWADFKGMGVSVVGTYSYKKERTNDSYRIFNEHELDELQEAFETHELLVGFNNIRFDNKLLEAAGCRIDRRKVYDIFCEIKAAAKAGTFAKGYALDNVARANDIDGKTGSGADAPFLWQDQKYHEVMTYCKQDIRITVSVLNKIIAGELVDPVKEVILPVRSPVIWA